MWLQWKNLNSVITVHYFRVFAFLQNSLFFEQLKIKFFILPKK